MKLTSEPLPWERESETTLQSLSQVPYDELDAVTLPGKEIASPLNFSFNMMQQFLSQTALAFSGAAWAPLDRQGSGRRCPHCTG